MVACHKFKVSRVRPSKFCLKTKAEYPKALSRAIASHMDEERKKKICSFSKMCHGGLVYFYKHPIMHAGLVLCVDPNSAINLKF